jgi:hypothetical protein
MSSDRNTSEDEIKVNQLKVLSQTFMSKMLVVFNSLHVIPLTNMCVVFAVTITSHQQEHRVIIYSIIVAALVTALV